MFRRVGGSGAGVPRTLSVGVSWRVEVYEDVRGRCGCVNSVDSDWRRVVVGLSQNSQDSAVYSVGTGVWGSVCRRVRVLKCLNTKWLSPKGENNE